MNPQVLIVVKGGVAEPICVTGDYSISEIDVLVVDKDSAEVGERSVSEFTVEKVNDQEFTRLLRKARRK
jgi:predicted metal-dependent TIM-barrel fold hydrolase